MDTAAGGKKPSRRRAERYPLKLQVELAHGAGMTRDVSIAGVYFVTDQPYRAGDSIEFTLVFAEAAPPAAIRLRCQGKVVRIEPREAAGEVGLAVQITSYTFTTAE